MQSNQEALLAAIHEQPEDCTPRLIYADWLNDFDDEELADWVRTQVELSRTPEVKWKAGTILGRRRVAGEKGKAAPHGVLCLPGMMDLPQPFFGENWGELEEYTPPPYGMAELGKLVVEQVVPMSVCEKDVPNPEHARLRTLLQARPDFCKAMAPPHWPPLSTIRPGDMISLSGSAKWTDWPRQLRRTVRPGEPFRVDLCDWDKKENIRLTDFTVQPPDKPCEVSIHIPGWPRRDGYAVQTVSLQPLQVYRHVAEPGSEIVAKQLDVSVVGGTATVMMQFGRVEPVQDRIDRRFNEWLNDMDRRVAMGLGVPPRLVMPPSGFIHGHTV